MAFTTEQNRVIESRNKNLIVSAAAGSGKTTVMIERIKDLIVRERVPISKFLVVTFTKASAADMKAKLIQKLSSQEPDPFVLEQIDDVATSDVSNLHSFCARLLKTYFYEAGLDPTFVVLSDEETQTLKEKALSELFEEKFEQNDQNFYILFDDLQQNRNDTLLRKTILELYNFLNIIFDRKTWFENSIKSLYNTDISKNKGANIINGYVCRRIEKFEKQIQEKIEYFNSLQIAEFVQYLQEIDSMLKTISLRNNFVKNAQNIDEICKFAPVPKVEDAFDEQRKSLSKFVKTIKDEIDNFKENYISADQELLQKDLTCAKQLLMTLFEATERFEEIYKNLKAEKCGLDYDDLEHYALKVLENDGIRQSLVQKYQYVFVDEYQDINTVQEKIISLLSRENNRFMVGDVKQSIYGFRLCDPSIFLEKYEQYQNNNQSEAINLSKNFRSNKNILNFVNMIFADRMTKDFGGVDYKRDAMLVAGTDFNEQNPVTVAYIDTGSLKDKKETFGQVEKGKVYSVKNHEQEETQEKLENRAEAEYIASEILDLVANKTIFDTEKQHDRSIRFRDIAVLIPARNSFLTTLLEIFKSKEIPFSTDASVDVFSDEYVKAVLNFLKLIYNPKQDIPLFGVLYSPLTDFTLSEIAEIRKLCSKCKFFYQVLANQSEMQQKNAKLGEKIANFTEKLKKYQQLAGYLSIKELAKTIIDESSLENIILTESDGKQRLALMDMFLDMLPEDNLYSYFASSEIASFETEQPANENAVQIVTIHKSKGLEYKVAFVANAGKNFNMQTSSHILASKDLGIGIDSFDNILRTKRNTIAKEAIKLTQTKDKIEEEQRLLYVALTRAINKLYVVCSKDFENLKKNFPERKNSFADWFDEFVCKHLDGEKLPFDINCIDADSLIDASYQEQKEPVIFGGPEQKMVESIKEQANKKYKYQQQTELPQKTSVTEIASGYHESEEVFEKYQTKTISSSIDKGNAYHKLMQHIDFSANCEEKLDNNIEKLLNSGKIDKKDLAFINKKAIIKLLLSKEFCSIVSSGKVLREKEFFMDMGQTDVQIVQGVIDLAVIRDNGTAIIVDYKTGNFAEKSKLAQYKKQIDLYAEAAKRIFSLSKVKTAIVAVEYGEVYYFE